MVVRWMTRVLHFLVEFDGLALVLPEALQELNVRPLQW